MKEYPKIYEDVFSSKRALAKLNWDQITITGDESVEVWGKKMRELVREIELKRFDFLVKFVWMARRFKRNGVGWKQNISSGMSVSGSLGVWAKNYGNFHFLSITNDYINKKIFTYLDDFFPGFDLNNPFENKYEYPYEYIGLSHLVLVYQMKERLELLQYGEENKMSYAKFSDFVLNQISCENEECGKEKYRFKFSTFFIPYIQNLDNEIYKARSRGYNKKSIK